MNSFGNSTRDELYRTDKTPGPGNQAVSNKIDNVF